MWQIPSMVNGYVFQLVSEFSYLGTNINNKINMHNEIKLRIASGNKGYYAMQNCLNRNSCTKDQQNIKFILQLSTGRIDV